MKKPIIFSETDARWQKLFFWLISSFLIGLFITGAFIYVIDPFNVSPIGVHADRPIMDINQRFYFPTIIRSKKFDSYVIGTSTSRLLDPADLGAAFGGNFANLAMSSATAWEQMQLLDLILRENGAPKTLVIGLDGPWCEQDADTNRLTFRVFPEWMYHGGRWKALRYQYNGETLEIAARLLQYWLGARQPRMRADGYDVFVPPDNTYDAARAREHIYAVVQDENIVDTRAGYHFPAHVWLDDYLGQLGGKTSVILAFMPINHVGLPALGTPKASFENACKQSLAAIAVRHDAVLMDFRIPSSITRSDNNYWDNLHYRLPIARRIVNDMKLRTPPKNGDWQKLN